MFQIVVAVVPPLTFLCVFFLFRRYIVVVFELSWTVYLCFLFFIFLFVVVVAAAAFFESNLLHKYRFLV